MKKTRQTSAEGTEQSIDDWVKRLTKDVVKGKINPLTAATEISDKIGPIRNVEFKEGKKFKVVGQADEKYDMMQRGLKKKEEKVYHDFACLMYSMVEYNEELGMGGVHISREIATKHHTDGYNSIIQKYAS